MKPKLGSLYLRGKTWWMQFYFNGQMYRESTKTKDPKEAERTIARRAGEIAVGKFNGPERITVGALLSNLLDTYRLEGRKSLYETELRIKKNLLDERSGVGKLRAADFGSRRIKEYISRRQKAGAATATINRELAALRTAFNLALRADPPMVSRAPHFLNMRENNARSGFLEHSQYRQLLEALPEELKMILVAGYHIGWRKSELLYLKWDQVDLVAKEVKLRAGTTKNDQPRTAPLYGDLLAWLTMAKTIRDERFPRCNYVFHREGSRVRDFRRAWSTACAEVGMDGLLVHDLRRSAVRNLIRAGVPQSIAMKITGHKTDAVFKRYDIVSAADLKMAAEKMTGHMEQMESQAQSQTQSGNLAGKENQGKSSIM